MQSDHFKSQIYCGANLFFTVDWNTEAAEGDWVVVEHLPTRRVRLQGYHGQKHYGVARILGYYDLVHSEQCMNRERRLYGR